MTARSSVTHVADAAALQKQAAALGDGLVGHKRATDALFPNGPLRAIRADVLLTNRRGDTEGRVPRRCGAHGALLTC